MSKGLSFTSQLRVNISGPHSDTSPVTNQKGQNPSHEIAPPLLYLGREKSKEKYEIFLHAVYQGFLEKYLRAKQRVEGGEGW